MTTIETKAKIVFDVDNRAKQALDKAGQQMKTLEKRTNNLQAAFKKMRNVGAVAFAGIVAGMGFVIAEAAKIETLEVAFTTMIGSAEKAQETIRMLRDFTAKTPFQFEGVTKATRQLLAFGVTSEELESKLKFLGDIAAGANIPLSDMAAIFGKSKAKGKAMTEELLQLSDRGVPIIDVLAQRMGVAKSEIFDLASKGKISFEILQGAMMSMSEEGGMFYDMMMKISETFEGRLSTLKDEVIALAQNIGAVFLPAAKEMIEKIMPIVQTLKEWVEENPKLTKTILLSVIAITGLTAGAGLLGLAVLGVTAGIGALGITMAAIMTGTVWGLIIAGVILLANKLKGIIETIYDVELSWKEVWHEMIDDISDAIVDIIEWIDKLIVKFNVVKFLFQDIKEKVTAGALDLAGRVIKVDDAIITPKGRVIQPADDDYIIATKDPGELGGNTFNFDFTNATITNKAQFMDDIKIQLGRGMQLKEVGI